MSRKISICVVFMFVFQLFVYATAEKIYFTSVGSQSKDSPQLCSRYLVEYDLDNDSINAYQIPLDAVVLSDPQDTGIPYVIYYVAGQSSPSWHYKVIRWLKDCSFGILEGDENELDICDNGMDAWTPRFILGIDEIGNLYSLRDFIDHPFYGNSGVKLLCENRKETKTIGSGTDIMYIDNWAYSSFAISDSGVFAWLMCDNYTSSIWRLYVFGDYNTQTEIECRRPIAWKGNELLLWKREEKSDVLYAYSYEHDELHPYLTQNGDSIILEDDDAANWTMALSDDNRYLSVFVCHQEDWDDYYGYRIHIIDLEDGSTQVITPWEEFSPNGIRNGIGRYTDNGIYLVNPFDVEKYNGKQEMYYCIGFR